MKNKLLKQLIAIKSYSGQENILKEFIANWFSGNNIKTINQGSNLLVHLPGTCSKKAFIFNSHMDTVSAGDEALWQYGPWNPTQKGKKLIGLGASDMKSGVAASMLTCLELSKTRPSVDLWFTFVVREEQDGSGTKELVDWFTKNGYSKKYREIAAIFTEPTGLSEVGHGNRGNIFFQATSSGDSGHASKPQDIKSHAVKKMFEFSVALEDQIQKWQKTYQSEIFDPLSVGLFTSISAGVNAVNNKITVDSPNKFPVICQASFDVRTIPGFHQVAVKEITKIAETLGVKLELLFPAAPTGYTEPDDKLLKVILEIVGNIKLTVFQGSSDLGFFSEIGAKGVIFGPGEMSQAHTLNEYCYPNQVDEAVILYKKIVYLWGNNSDVILP